jgi:hypothetical protein
MPDKRHYEKWLIQAPIALLLCAVSILSIFYFIAHEKESINGDNWMMWGLISASLFMAGIGLLSNAIVHKVKADLSRKKRSKSGSSETIEP